MTLYRSGPGLVPVVVVEAAALVRPYVRIPRADVGPDPGPLRTKQPRSWFDLVRWHGAESGTSG